MPEKFPEMKTEMTEAQAEEELHQLLEEPSNQFLNDIPMNRDRIDNAETAKEALDFARTKIRERTEASVRFNKIAHIEGVEMDERDLYGLSRTVEHIWSHAQTIGVGGDAVVVIDKNEIRNLPPEICYKFATAEKTRRGRNPVAEEAELHGEFYEAAKEMQSHIGVPQPFYSLEVNDKKLIAMEKLPAQSVDDILRGKGNLPDWVDIDTVCDDLKLVLDELHGRHLYHRDMHFGNILINQKAVPEKDEKMAYIIDFGLSGTAEIEEYAYKKEVAGYTFTYNNDYGIISQLRQSLKALRSRV